VAYFDVVAVKKLVVGWLPSYLAFLGAPPHPELSPRGGGKGGLGPREGTIGFSMCLPPPVLGDALSSLPLGSSSEAAKGAEGRAGSYFHGEGGSCCGNESPPGFGVLPESIPSMGLKNPPFQVQVLLSLGGGLSSCLERGSLGRLLPYSVYI